MSHRKMRQLTVHAQIDNTLMSAIVFKMHFLLILPSSYLPIFRIFTKHDLKCLYAFSPLMLYLGINNGIKSVKKRIG